MLQKIKHYTKDVLIFIVVMSIFANIISLYKSQELSDAPLMLKSVTLIDGSNYELKKGVVTVVHFWATWCPTCKLEADNIQRLSKYYQVLTIAVNSGNNQEIQNYLDERGLSFKVLNDEHSIYAKEFQIAGYPTTFIYDKEGNLIFSEVGYTSTLGLLLRVLWASL